MQRSIEWHASDRVGKIFNKEFWNDKVDIDVRGVKNLMVDFATEQVKSARDREREHCINVASNLYCELCKSHNNDNCNTTVENCPLLIRLRFMMNGSGTNNTPLCETCVRKESGECDEFDLTTMCGAAYKHK